MMIGFGYELGLVFFRIDRKAMTSQYGQPDKYSHFIIE